MQYVFINKLNGQFFNRDNNQPLSLENATVFEEADLLECLPESHIPLKVANIKVLKLNSHSPQFIMLNEDFKYVEDGMHGQYSLTDDPKRATVFTPKSFDKIVNKHKPLPAFLRVPVTVLFIKELVE